MISYANKCLSPDQAAALIEPGQRVVLGHAAATPLEVVKAMTDDKTRYKNVEIVHMLSLGKAEYMRKDMAGHFSHNALFVGGNTRDGIKNKQGDYTPCFFYEVPKLFSEGLLPVDVAIIQVSPPDERGMMSFGLSNDYTSTAAKMAKVVIAEVNTNMPRVYGDNFIHLSDVNHIVEVNHPIPELPMAAIGPVEEAIGQYCASLIQDGDTLQLGIGAIPDAALKFLGDKKDLGIHTEMFSDGVVDLYEKGVITGKKKSLYPGKMISTFLMGSKKLYDFVHNNPAVELHPVDYVNHPAIIMRNENMVSINSALQVDLMGQVAAETIGLSQFSGVGGQVDYVRGAAMSRGGRSIIAMPSTASKGTRSRIVDFLEPGNAVTTSRNDVHYVITEYGIAHLKGKTLRERAKALIQIAHPDFRDQLYEAFHQRF